MLRDLHPDAASLLQPNFWGMTSLRDSDKKSAPELMGGAFSHRAAPRRMRVTAGSV